MMMTRMTAELSMTVQQAAVIDDDRPRFLSETDCQNIMQRVAQLARGGGYTTVGIVSTWRGNVRWARNLISTSGEVTDHQIRVSRDLNGAQGSVVCNDTTEAALLAAAREAERLAALQLERPQSDLVTRRTLEPAESPQLFSHATYQLDADHRAAAAITLAEKAARASMLSAGYIEVVARSMALLDTLGRSRYFQYTQAQYSVTVRSPDGSGSGWAGDMYYDWAKLHPDVLTTRALDKCLASRNPVRIEPGRYTTILEPQATGDFVSRLLAAQMNEGLAIGFTDNLYRSTRGDGPFNKDYQGPHHTHLGERVVDERITISADPMDPELGFPPYYLANSSFPDQFEVPVYHKTTWIERGVLTNLAYDRDWAIRSFGRNTSQLSSGSFRMTGGTTTVEEMIATTKRGVLVTRFDRLEEMDFASQLWRGYTRDGLWLVENGKISKPAKNLVFTESILFALNNIEQLGVPTRVFHRGFGGTGLLGAPQPVIVPALKIRDFSFTALTSAV